MDDLVMYLKRQMMAEKNICMITDKLVLLQSNEERIKFLLYIMFRYKIKIGGDGDLKDPVISDTYKEEAVRLFHFMMPPYTEDKYDEVFKLFAKSIAHAPRQSEQLGLAYADRSNILFFLKKYELCIQDIERAMQLPHSATLRLTLSIRKIKCQRALWHQNIDNWNQEAYRSKRDIYRRIYHTELGSTKVAGNVSMPDNPNQLPLTGLENRNTEARCLSDAVAIAYDAEKGRHLVATRDIQPGELLITEEPYTVILTESEIYSKCYNCFEETWASIPCDYCTWAMFCSEECKTVSWQKYHDIECTVCPSVWEMSEEFLELNLCSVRLTVQAVREFGSIEELRKEVRNVDECRDPRIKGFSESGILTGKRYRNVLGLKTEIEALSKDGMFLLCLQASLILVCLATRSTLFGCPLNNTLSAIAKNKNALFIGALIMRHLQLNRINGSYIFGQRKSGENFLCAFGILPFSSLMNRSSDPNIFRRDITERPPLHYIVHHYARETIKKGEQILTSYFLFESNVINLK